MPRTDAKGLFGWHLQRHPFSTGLSHEPVQKVFLKHF
jgi:hypothetical protein